jgi:thiol-disulfide isomerase/thioredoxin
MKKRLYTAEHCVPCREIEAKVDELIKAGDDIEVIDIETDEGFKIFQNEVMSKSDDDELLVVPSAYQDGQRCKISFDEDDKLVLDCPESKLQNLGSNQSQA